MLKRLGACFAFLLLAAVAARPLTLLLLTDADIVAQSERVVVGTVTTAQARWMDPDGDGFENIYTVATFRIDQTVKGNDPAGTILTLHVLGGTIGERTQLAPGVPLFTNGERLLLCLERNPETAKLSPIAGVIQGRWTVTTADDGTEVARRSYSDAHFMSRTASGNLADANAPGDSIEPLADLVARLQAEAAK
ncbi:MAG: hypothetical protein HYY18_20050 [Planctomycetes bacterium]|nr:hypothetical protein [Planctomycetota bacterium]